MSIGTFIYNVCLGPLLLFFEMVFHTADKLVGNHGVAIIILSLTINILVLPLYMRADKLQRQQRELEKMLQPGIDHIKKTFSGDERFMIIQTYYRQNNYSPMSSLKGATSLLLQIPFFLCAYRMLSSLSILNGYSFGPISDLGSPDRLITIGSFSINALPILMTLINIISSAIYTRDLALKDKIRTYLLAFLFLVLLYNSPSGLTFYWTLNNLFSLCKNIVETFVLKRKSKSTSDNTRYKPLFNSKLSMKPFILSGIYITLFTGVFIPAYILNSSPLECMDNLLLDNPMKYVLYSLSLAIGTFIVWASILYYLSPNRIRNILSMIAPGLAAYFTSNCFNYRGGLFNFSVNLAAPADTGISFDSITIIINFLILLGCILFAGYLFVRMRFALYTLLAIGIIFIGFIGFYTANIGNTIYLDSVIVPNKSPTKITLSSTEPNVVVIMLDKAASYHMNNILELYPEMEEEYDGFTFYPNTASFGACTNTASPALFGGYEYIPEISNQRPEMSLEEKQNESLLVMPRIFADNNYDITVIDPPYAGYQTTFPDLEIYDSIPNISAYTAIGELNPYRDVMETQINNIKERNLFCYSLLCIVPPPLCSFVYDNGNYNQAERSEYAVQTATSLTEAYGMNYNTARAYSVLDALPEITEVNSGNSNLLIFQNSLCHDGAILQEPEMTLGPDINNPENLAGKLVDNSMTDVMQLHVNTAALMLLGDWFNFLRENDCYDNTRIIIVSDHGYSTSIPEYALSGNQNLGFFMPLFMVKDFGSTGFHYSDEFMTNADTPALAMDGIVENPINPFTGHAINRKWLNHDTINIFNLYSPYILQENGNVFSEGDWFTVHDNVMDPSNWVHYNSYEDIPQN